MKSLSILKSDKYDIILSRESFTSMLVQLIYSSENEPPQVLYSTDILIRLLHNEINTSLKREVANAIETAKARLAYHMQNDEFADGVFKDYVR